MRRACAALILTVAALIPLLRYHPNLSASARTAVHASPPPQADTGAPASPETGTGTGTGTPMPAQTNTSAPAPPQAHSGVSLPAQADTSAPAPAHAGGNAVPRPQAGAASAAPTQLGGAGAASSQAASNAPASPRAGSGISTSPQPGSSAATPPQVGSIAAGRSGITAPSHPKTVTGSMVTTQFGPYQVQVVFTSSKITDVQLITEPSDRHSQRIAAIAAPILRQEALQAQNAVIDTVSGATITSQAYAQSLQAAIDAKGS